MLTENELNEAKEKAGHFFEKDNENPRLLSLTHENVVMVEALICTDSAYLKSSDRNAAPVRKRNGELKYGGSIAYWMSKLSNCYKTNGNEIEFKKLINGAVDAVDRETSTHLNSDGIGREITKRRIRNYGDKNLYTTLKSKDENKYNLFRELASLTKENDGGRCNVSFATKFCHYASYYLFEGEEQQDNFSIYDSVVMSVLLEYAQHWQVNMNDTIFNGNENDYKRNGYKAVNDYKHNPDGVCQFYKDYSAVIGEIIKKSGDQISRNGFDHLLWYYHKGHPIDD